MGEVAARRPTLPVAELPPVLRDFEPAHRWHPETVKVWQAIAELNADPASMSGDLEVEPEVFIEVGKDVWATTGPSAFANPEKGRIMFCGRWVVPRG